MKYREVLLEQLKNLPYFDKKTIYQLSEQYGLKKTTVDTYISRSLKRKDIIPLKRGLYVSTDYFDKNRGDISYLFYIANILRTPSYISSWTALQYYNLATEVIHTTFSITNKVTRIYQTKIGNFGYQSIKKERFTDFSLVKGKFDFFIASPAKALFDLLYFKTRRFSGIDVKNIKSLIDELRIDFDEMDKNEQEKFFQMIKKYAKK
jgi:predicted transcriptional regulator of viral defense system